MNHRISCVGCVSAHIVYCRARVWSLRRDTSPENIKYNNKIIAHKNMTVDSTSHPSSMYSFQRGNKVKKKKSRISSHSIAFTPNPYDGPFCSYFFRLYCSTLIRFNCCYWICLLRLSMNSSSICNTAEKVFHALALFFV